MADPAIALGATDYFGLDANFLAQSSSLSTEITSHWEFDHVARPFGTNVLNPKKIANVVYKFIGTNLRASLGLLGTNLREAGDYQIDSIGLEFSAFDYPTVDITGHVHTNVDATGRIHSLLLNVHNAVEFNWALVLPNVSANGMAIGEIESATHKIRSNPPGAVITDFVERIEITHLDINGHNGQHEFGGHVSSFVGASFSGVGDIAKIKELLGRFWLVTNEQVIETNTAHDSFSMDVEGIVGRT